MSLARRSWKESVSTVACAIREYVRAKEDEGCIMKDLEETRMTDPGKKSEFTVLAGDIGGTHTRLGLFTAGEKKPNQKAEEIFSSDTAKGLEEIIERFLGKHEGDITDACFGIAGPVEKNRTKTTNLPWEVGLAIKIQKRFGFARVRLMNDVAATHPRGTLHAF